MQRESHCVELTNRHLKHPLSTFVHAPPTTLPDPNASHPKAAVPILIAHPTALDSQKQNSSIPLRHTRVPNATPHSPHDRRHDAPKATPSTSILVPTPQRNSYDADAQRPPSSLALSMVLCNVPHARSPLAPHTTPEQRPRRHPPPHLQRRD